MMNPWRPLALAAVVTWTLGIGVAAAQTATATNAPAGTTVELVVNSATAGSATADAAGFATIPINMDATMAGKRETDVYIFVDMCADSRRVGWRRSRLMPGGPSWVVPARLLRVRSDGVGARLP